MKSGFTLPELILVMGILLTLFALVTNSLLGSQHQTSLNSLISSLISDIKSQQFKSMSGDTAGRGMTDTYGVYFASGQYVLFLGSAYSSGNPDNFTVSLDSNLQLSTTFPSQSVIFSKGSGEIIGYDANADTITISSPSDSKTLEFNQYGVIVRNE